MKILHYSIITVLIFIILVTLIIEFPIYRGPNALIVPSKPYIENTNTLHGLPDYNIGLVFNGTQTSRDAPFYLKQGQNFTLIANITSIPTNLPVSLDIDSHVGFTKTNGVDSKLSVTKIKTPEQVMIYVSATKDATPNTYQILVEANDTLMTMNSNFYVKVIPSDENQGHIINTVESECENEFKPKEFQTGVFPNGTSYTVTYVPVFLLKPNSTGKICINNWSYNKSYDWAGKTFEEPWQYCQGAYSCIQVTPSPQNITVNSVTNTTIVYTISSSGSQKGLFEVSPLFYDCTGLPVAVGYDSSHLFDNDFPWLWKTVPCYFSGVHSEIIGTSGIDVAYITKEYR